MKKRFSGELARWFRVGARCGVRRSDTDIWCV